MFWCLPSAYDLCSCYQGASGVQLFAAAVTSNGLCVHASICTPGRVRECVCVCVGCGVGTFRVLLLQLLLCRRHCGHVTDLRLVLSFPLLLLLHGTSMIVAAAAVVDVVSADVCRRSRDRCRHR